MTKKWQDISKAVNYDFDSDYFARYWWGIFPEFKKELENIIYKNVKGVQNE